MISFHLCFLENALHHDSHSLCSVQRLCYAELSKLLNSQHCPVAFSCHHSGTSSPLFQAVVDQSWFR